TDVCERNTLIVEKHAERFLFCSSDNPIGGVDLVNEDVSSECRTLDYERASANVDIHIGHVTSGIRLTKRRCKACCALYSRGTEVRRRDAAKLFKLRRIRTVRFIEVTGAERGRKREARVLVNMWMIEDGRAFKLALLHRGNGCRVCGVYRIFVVALDDC